MNEAWKQWEGHVVDGRYALKQFLGKSDHSAVFQTTHGNYAQAAALKFVEANPASAQAQLARWDRVSKLEHRHLQRVFHWGRCQLGTASMLYVVTDFAEENLGQILPNRALSIAETEYMLRNVLEVLGYLHNSGYAHGRLKPGNIMAVAEDLRLAGDTIRPAGEKELTPHLPTPYDAPESSTAGSTPEADIWSLGVTLVEALTQKASPGEAVRQGDPNLPEAIPQPFVEIARQCLRLDPQRRWTVPEIAARLLPTPTPVKKSSRAPYVVAAGAVLAAGLLAGPRLLHQRPTANTSDPTTSTPARSEPSGNAGGGNTPAQPAAPALEPVPKTPRKPAESAHGEPRSNGSTAPGPANNAAMTTHEGGVADRVLPRVSQRSLNTITGKVRVAVKVSVDPTGKVSSASLQSAGPSQYFAHVALEASRHWKFDPPQSSGEPRPSQWMLHYVFGHSGVEVHPEQVSR
jgi:TonB family protein